MDKTYIQDTAYGGYGVGKMPDGRVVFIPHTVEGDTVTYTVTEDKSKFVYGDLAEVLEPSAKRGELYCPHIGKCGGCVFGHIDYANQLEIKKGFVLTAFARNKIEIPEPEIVSGNLQEFRNRATFRIRNGQIGFFAFKSNSFIPVDECPVIKKSMVEKAKQFAAKAEDCSLYITENENGEALAKADIPVTDQCGFAGLKGTDGIRGSRRIAFDTPYGAFYADFGSFSQGNRHISSKLQDFVYEHSEGSKGLDLYCGTGFLTLPLAKRCAKVEAVESYAPAIRLAEKTGLKNVRWHAARSEEIARRLGRGFDVIVADPPRTGMDKAVCRFIKDSGAEKLILISCDPNTLARDIARVGDSYRVSRLCIADLFPGSYHVESLALLNKVK